ncbi:MAG: hypothetical protein ACK5YZ_00265 [bacterium]
MRRFDVLFGVTVAAGMLLRQALGLLGEHAPFAGRILVEPQQALQAQGDSVAHPHAANGWRGDADADQSQLIGDADVAVSGELRRHVENLLLELGPRLVGHAWPPK